MARKYSALKEGRWHAAEMMKLAGNGAQRREFEKARAAIITAITQSLKDDKRAFKDGWKALGRLYMNRAKQETEPSFQMKLWNNAALSYARLLYIDEEDNGTLDQDSRMKLEILERRPENEALFADVIGLVTEALQDYTRKHGRFPALMDVYGSGEENIPYALKA